VFGDGAGGDPLPCRAPIAAVTATGAGLAAGGALTGGYVRVSLPRGATPILLGQASPPRCRYRGRPRAMVGPTAPAARMRG
jgi:hypothetical protein